MLLKAAHTRPAPIVIGFVVLLACAACASWFLASERTADAWVRHTLQVENRLSSAQLHISRAETSRRGFLLTGDRTNVATYLALRRVALPEFDALAVMVHDNPPQYRRAVALRAIARARFASMARSMRLFESDGVAAATRAVADPAEQGRITRLIAMADAMRANEDDLLVYRTERTGRMRRLAIMALTASGMLILLLALLVERERRRRVDALVAANRLLEEDIEARKLLEAELTRARSRAEAADRAKSNFLADMSHEIRTPMNGVIGFTELLVDSGLDANQRRYAELIADSGRAMIRLLNDILDLSKVEAGHMKIAAEPFDVVHTLRGCGKLVAPAVEQRGLAFRTAFAADLPKLIVGDGLRLRQIVLNLLSNAAKFTASGAIDFRAEAADVAGRRMLRVEVEDTGIGIARDQQHAIFEEFVQADDAITPRFGGTGLGLAISAKLARLMGGELRLESEIGRGSRFTLTVPMREAAGSAAAAEAPAAIPAPPAAIAPGSIRILVAEDHDVNQALILAMLDRIGVAADLARNGGEAVELVRAAQAADRGYALVLMDMQMPDIDGCEASRRIRALGIAPETLPILALTANAYAEDIATCFAAGMQAHLTKPLSSAELAAAIARWAQRPTIAPEAEGRAPRRHSARLEALYATRRAEMLALIDALAAGDRVTDAQVSSAASVLHKFLGTAAMFGDAEMAEQVRVLEQGFASWSRGERIGGVRAAAAAIRRAA